MVGKYDLRESKIGSMEVWVGLDRARRVPAPRTFLLCSPMGLDLRLAESALEDTLKTL